MKKFRWAKSLGGLMIGAFITALSTRLTVLEEVDRKLKKDGVVTDKKEES